MMRQPELQFDQSSAQTLLQRRRDLLTFKEGHIGLVKKVRQVGRHLLITNEAEEMLCRAPPPVSALHPNLHHIGTKSGLLTFIGPSHENVTF